MLKRKIINKPGTFNLNLLFLPLTTQAQIEFKEKQQIKAQAGLLSEHWFKNRNLNKNQTLDNILINLNIAKSNFHAKQILKAKRVKVENKIITSTNYIIKPFLKINNNVVHKELTLLNKIRDLNIKNTNVLINQKFIFKNKKYTEPACIKKYR